MLIGQTGAGKSYMGNALLGCLNPAHGPFSTGDQRSSDSVMDAVTIYVNGKTGSFFGNENDRNLGIEHFEFNVVDTPGWGDTDPRKRKKNSQRVAQSLNFGVNLFFFVKSSIMVRFSETEQDILGDLHMWTNGAFWKRLGWFDYFFLS